MRLTEIECELSYAYIHTVAAKAGVACQMGTRQFDNAGIDATLHVVRDFGAKLTEFSLHIQLKATVSTPVEKDGNLAYYLKGVEQYNSLRAATVMPPKILVVLFLPENAEEWLSHSVDQLILKRCAYWVSLRGAPDCTNDTGQTVYLPKSQVFSPDGLMTLLGRVARQEELLYGK